MKKYILSLTMLMALNSFAQIGTAETIGKSITVGRIATLGNVTAELSYSIKEATDTFYMLSYHNQKYKSIKDTRYLQFKQVDGAVDQLYLLFKSVFTDENRDNKDYAVTVPIGKDNVLITRYKSMGVLMVAFFNGDDYGVLTERQVDKLFGKN